MSFLVSAPSMGASDSFIFHRDERHQDFRHSSHPVRIEEGSLLTRFSRVLAAKGPGPCHLVLGISPKRSAELIRNVNAIPGRDGSSEGEASKLKRSS